MRQFRNFLSKLIYSLVAAIVISSYVGTIDNSFLSTGATNQIVYAKKSQKTKKRNEAVESVTVSTSWRWKKPKATVYVNLNGNRSLASATDAAIAAWNNTGAFTFTKTKNKKKADITIGQVYSPNIDYAGYTTLHYYVSSGFLISATTKLNTYYLDNHSTYHYNHERIINTVEHELGHALGLKHNTGSSVMYPTGSIFSIQPDDVMTVEALYKR